MKHLNDLKEKIDKLTAKMDVLESARKTYYELSFERDRLNEEYREKLYKHDLFVLKIKTKYKEPTYPEMGSLSENGSASFDNKEEADKLVKMLREKSYTYGYVLVWDGPGEYVIEPSYKYDHDNDIIYTATFKRINNGL